MDAFDVTGSKGRADGSGPASGCGLRGRAPGCVGAAGGIASNVPIAIPVRIRPGVRCHCPMDGCAALVTCTGGGITVQLAGRAPLRLAAGDAALMPARSQYCVDAGRGGSGAEVMLSVAGLRASHGEVVSCSPVLASFLNASADGEPLVFRGIADAAFTGSIQALFTESERRGVLFRESIDCAVRQMVIALARGARAGGRGGGGPLSMEAIEAYLRDHLEDATLAGCARHFSYHPNTVALFIKRSTGETFGELVTALRMRRAQELVAGSDIPVQRIAESCGYRNMTHFYDLFRRLFDCTPGEYRAAIAA